MPGVVLYFDVFRRDDAFDSPVWGDDESGAESAHIFSSAESLLTPHAELVDERVFGVGNEAEGEVVFLDELLVFLGIVDAHADDFEAGGLELGVVVAEVARFAGAPWSAVFGVEVEGESFACEVGESDFVAVLVET